MSSYYWEFSETLNFVDNPGYDHVIEDIQDICRNPSTCTNCTETDCFEVTYILTTLTTGYHFNDESFGNINFVKDIDGAEASWALGFMTDKTNEIENAKEDRAISFVAFVIMIVMGSLLTFVGALAVIVFHRQHNNRILNRPSKD